MVKDILKDPQIHIGINIHRATFINDRNLDSPPCLDIEKYTLYSNSQYQKEYAGIEDPVVVERKDAEDCVASSFLREAEAKIAALEAKQLDTKKWWRP